LPLLDKLRNYLSHYIGNVFLEQQSIFLKGQLFNGYNLLTLHQQQRLREKIDTVIVLKSAARKTSKKLEVLANLKIKDDNALPLTVICISTIVKYSIDYEDKLPKELALKFKDYLYLEYEKLLLQIQMKPIEMKLLLLNYNIPIPTTKTNIKNSEIIEDEIIMALVNKTISHNFEIPILSSKKRLEFSDKAENDDWLGFEDNPYFDQNGLFPINVVVEDMEHVSSPGKRIQNYIGPEEPERKRKKSPK